MSAFVERVSSDRNSCKTLCHIRICKASAQNEYAYGNSDCTADGRPKYRLLLENGSCNRLVANCAFEFLIGLVREQVILVIAILMKSSATDLTQKWFQTCKAGMMFHSSLSDLNEMQTIVEFA